MKFSPLMSGRFVSRAVATAACLALLVLGTGCVSWDPIFRGSVGVMRWLTGH